jgi:CBS domain-containing protein
MSYPAVTCHVNDSLSQAAHLMWEHDCGALGVVNDEGVLTSMITDRDICMAAYTQGRCLGDIRVEQAMGHGIVSCVPSDDVASAAATMGATQLRRLAVVDDAQHLVGLISLADIARAAAVGNETKALAAVGRTLAAVTEPRHAASA